MNEQNNQNSYFYHPDGNNDENMQQYYQQTQPEQPKKKRKAKKALKIIEIIFGVLIILFIALVIIAVVTDDTDYDADESTAQSEMQDDESGKPVLGTFADESYTNEHADLKFNLPGENWEFKSDEYIYDIFRNSGGETDEDGNVFLNGGNAKYYYDMMALDNTTSTSVQFVVTKPEKSIFSTTTEDMFLNNSKAVSGEAAASEIYDITIAGETYRAIDLYDEDSELGFGQTMAAKKLDDEFVIIIISGYAKVIDENLSDYIDYFVKP